MDGIILAGGKGTRMRPLTDTTPKPLLIVQGRPILEWSLLSLRPSIDRVLVVAKYLKEQIESYMAAQTLFDDYAIVEQLPEPLGTGHALQCCRPALHSDEFLVINGDDLFGSRALAALAAAPYGILTVERDDATKWGVVVANADGTVARLHEKPDKGLYPPPVQVNIGAYKLDQSIFAYDLPLSPRGEYEITDYISRLAADQPVSAVPCDFWFPIGNPDDLARAQTTDIAPWLLSQ
jgi:bifunctional UDP-N-acetylglucosamine pyrophosphorylase/glucosamine-1-phosphate N-acetyltransferase